MSDQLTFAGMEDQLAPEEKIYSLLYPVIADVLHEAAVPENKLEITKQKTYYSITLCGKQLVLRIKISKRLGSMITFRQLNGSNSSLFKGLKENTTKQDKKLGFIRIVLPDGQVTDQISEIVKEIIEDSVEKLTKQYDCCSRYEACSNAGKCIHPDADFALGCGYRQVLRKGIIYYGKNRNVD